MKASRGITRLTRNRGRLGGDNGTEHDISESDFGDIFFHTLPIELVPDTEVISNIPLGKEHSATLLAAYVLRSGREILGQDARETAPTRTAINGSREVIGQL